MVAYQFAFFTFYQLIEKVSIDGFIAYKAALVLSFVNIWLLAVILEYIAFVFHSQYVPPLAVWVGMALLISAAPYLLVYEYGPWRDYLEHFKKLPRGRLLLGRLIVVCFVAGLGALLILLRPQ